MKKVLAFTLLAACTVGDAPTGTTGGGDDDGTGTTGTDAGTGGTIDKGTSGAIADGTHLTGMVHITGAATIAAGATVTIDAGATVTVANGAGLTVSGTLKVAGSKASPVTIGPDLALVGGSPSMFWSGIDIKAGGTMTMTYGTQKGGGIYIDGGTANVMDSNLSNAQGDYLVMNGGTIDVEYSNVGLAASGDSTHCNLHFNTATKITFTHNNNMNSPFGLMFYGGTGAVFTHNNWISNKTAGQVDIEPNPGGTGDFSDSYFSNGQPAGTTGLTYGTPSTTKLTDCGPR